MTVFNNNNNNSVNNVYKSDGYKRTIIKKKDKLINKRIKNK